MKLRYEAFFVEERVDFAWLVDECLHCHFFVMLLGKDLVNRVVRFAYFFLEN